MEELRPNNDTRQGILSLAQLVHGLAKVHSAIGTRRYSMRIARRSSWLPLSRNLDAATSIQLMTLSPPGDQFLPGRGLISPTVQYGLSSKLRILQPDWQSAGE